MATGMRTINAAGPYCAAPLHSSLSHASQKTSSFLFWHCWSASAAVVAHKRFTITDCTPFASQNRYEKREREKWNKWNNRFYFCRKMEVAHFILITFILQGFLCQWLTLKFIIIRLCLFKRSKYDSKRKKKRR